MEHQKTDTQTVVEAYQPEKQIRQRVEVRQTSQQENLLQEETRMFRQENRTFQEIRAQEIRVHQEHRQETMIHHRAETQMQQVEETRTYRAEVRKVAREVHHQTAEVHQAVHQTAELVRAEHRAEDKKYTTQFL